MCLSCLSDRGREVGILYGLLTVRPNNQVRRICRFDQPLQVNEDGWEYVDDDKLLCCDYRSEKYRPGFHMYENFKDARNRIACWDDDSLLERIIIVAFDWEDMRAQGRELAGEVSVVGARKPLWIVWDSKYLPG